MTVFALMASKGLTLVRYYKNDQQQVMSTHHAVFAFHLQTPVGVLALAKRSKLEKG